MGEVIEAIIIRVLPDLEVTVKGCDNDMFEMTAKIISALRKKGLMPDIEMVPAKELRDLLDEKRKT